MIRLPKFIFVAGLCFATSVFSGCGNSLQNQVTGKWTIDTEEDLFGMIGDEDAHEASATFQIEFQKGGVFKSSVVASGYKQEKDGRWFFVEGAGDVCQLRVHINSSNSKLEPDNVLTEVKFIDENTIVLIPPNMDAVKHKMTFRRMK